MKNRIDIVFTYPNTMRNILVKHNATSGALDKDYPKFYFGESGRAFEKAILSTNVIVRYTRESNGWC